MEEEVAQQRAKDKRDYWANRSNRSNEANRANKANEANRPNKANIQEKKKVRF